MNAGRTTGTGPGKNREAANRLPADRPLAMVAGKRIEGTRREARPRPPASMGSGVSMKIFPGIFLARVRGPLLAAIFLAASLGVAGGIARAQSVDLSTDQVTVDLSVIDGSGTGPAAASFMTRPQGLAPRLGLLLPGNKNPVSQLHVAAPKGTARIKLKRPGSKVEKAAKRVARKKPPAKKPEIKKPEPPKVAAAKPPEPLITAPAPPAPKAVAKTTPKPVAKPPASKPMEKAAAKPSPPPKPAPQQQAKAAPPAPSPAPPPLPKPVVKKPTASMPAPPKAPVVAAKPKPESKVKEQAAVAPAPKETKTGQALRVTFGATASKLPAAAKNDLKALAKKIKGKDNLRLQLMAYAGGKSLSASKARRMSLSRALSVRSFLIENGVRSTRIDVQALGSKTTEKPLNRVDVNIVKR